MMILPICLFGVAFLAVLVLGFLVRAGIINRRVASILSLAVVVPFVCLVLYSIFTILTGGPGGPFGPDGPFGPGFGPGGFP